MWGIFIFAVKVKLDRLKLTTIKSLFNLIFGVETYGEYSSVVRALNCDFKSREFKSHYSPI